MDKLAQKFAGDIFVQFRHLFRVNGNFEESRDTSSRKFNYVRITFRDKINFRRNKWSNESVVRVTRYTATVAGCASLLVHRWKL